MFSAEDYIVPKILNCAFKSNLIPLGFLWIELCSGWILPAFHLPVITSMHVMYVDNAPIILKTTTNKQIKTTNVESHLQCCMRQSLCCILADS